MLRLAFLLALAATALLAPSAHAERRVALVIGNSAYVNANALRNPKNDAADIAAALRKVGFEVDLGLDLDQRGLAVAIEKFARMLEGADVGLFYYAGHALQINDKNYLVSTTAKLDNEFLISSETMELEPIVRLMESKVPVNLVFLDACRNNPLADNLRRNMAALKRSANLGRGLARIESSGHDTLIAFAAAPGQEAADGMERNSPFTGALLRRMPQPGLEVSVMLKEVAADVRRDTQNAQRPQQLSDMARTFYFVPSDAAASPVVAAAPQTTAPKPDTGASDRALDVAYWSSVQSANDCESMRAYIQRFPEGVFIDLARLSERRLCAPTRRVTVEPAPDPAQAVAMGPATTPAPPPVSLPPPNAAPMQAPQSAEPAPAPQPSLAARPEVTSTPEAAKPDGTALARDAHVELTRLGCLPGDVDRPWGRTSRDAVAKFNRYAHAKLSADQPSQTLIAALREHEDKVCPLECGRGYRASGDSCVAIERVEPHKDRKALERQRQEQRAQEREQRRERARASARASTDSGAGAVSRPPKPKAAGPEKAEFASPLCQSRIQVGQKWCCTYDPPRGPSVVICK